MMIFATICFMFGAALGSRHKVFVLIPAGIVVFGAVAGIAFTSHFGIWRLLLTEFIVLTALQLGYLVGAGVAAVVVKSRELKDTAAIAAKAQRLS
jgi:hypothetical protein